jgi:hypothetical protein
MLQWPGFVEKYAKEHNILYDTALESSECIAKYQKYRDDQREKHRQRKLAMSEKADGFRKEKHRQRILAMSAKADKVVQEFQEQIQQQISEHSENNHEKYENKIIQCRLPPTSVPTIPIPIPQNTAVVAESPKCPVRPKQIQRKTMIFTNYSK